MQIKSFAFLNSGKKNITKLLIFQDDPHGYYALGVGDSHKQPSPDDNPLMGDEQCWKVPEKSLIESSGEYFAEWSAEFHYGDLPSNTIREVAIARNTTNGTSDGLVRMAVNEIKMTPGSVVRIKIRLSPQEMQILI